MTWKIKGKIGLHFPNTGNTGNSNQDTYKIVYSSDGVQSNLQEIKKVYFLTPADASYISSLSTTEAQLAELTSGKYDVWERYWEEPPSQRTLVAGTQHVAIEYIPSQDISVTDIGIFTNDNSTGRQPRIKIFHECGLCIAAMDGDVQTTDQVLYELNGSNHDAVIQATTLKAEQKYYIVYSPGYGGGNTFYPAYFQNENGNYKVYENENSMSQMTIIDMSSFGNNLGICSDIDGFIEAPENDYMTWSGNLTGYESNKLYVRSAVKLDGIYVGKIGTGQGLNATSLLTIGQLNENDIFNWDSWNSGGLEQYKNYQRNSSYPKDKFKKSVSTLTDGYDVGAGNIFTYETSFYEMSYDLNKITTLAENEPIRQTVELLLKCNDTTTMHWIVPAFWYEANRILRRKVEGQTTKLSTTPLTGSYTTDTLGAVNGDILFVNNSFRYNDVQIANNETIVKYDSSNDSFTILAEQYDSDNVWKNIFEKVTSDLYIKYSVTDILKSGTIDFSILIKSSYTPDYTFVNTPVNTDKKFYLKLNGREV